MTRQVELYIEQGLTRDGYDLGAIHEKIGERLVRLGKITREQADEVLKLQREKHDGKRFGDIVLELALMSQQDLEDHTKE